MRTRRLSRWTSAPTTRAPSASRSSSCCDAHADGRLWACAVRPDVIYGRYDRQFIPRAARMHAVAAISRCSAAGGRRWRSCMPERGRRRRAARWMCRRRAGARTIWRTTSMSPCPTSCGWPRSASSGTFAVIPVPLGLARAGFAAARAALIATRRRTLGNDLVSALDFVSRDNPFSSERARRELGMAAGGAAGSGYPRGVPLVAGTSAAVDRQERRRAQRIAAPFAYLAEAGVTAS